MKGCLNTLIEWATTQYSRGAIGSSVCAGMDQPVKAQEGQRQDSEECAPVVPSPGYTIASPGGPKI